MRGLLTAAALEQQSAKRPAGVHRFELKSAAQREHVSVPSVAFRERSRCVRSEHNAVRALYTGNNSRG